LDSVEGLGEFVELEVVLSAEGGIEDGISVAHSLMARLGIDPDDLVEESYIDLIEEPNDSVS
jgi:adenylate cyclase class IV